MVINDPELLGIWPRAPSHWNWNRVTSKPQGHFSPILSIEMALYRLFIYPTPCSVIKLHCPHTARDIIILFAAALLKWKSLSRDDWQKSQTPWIAFYSLVFSLVPYACFSGLNDMLPEKCSLLKTGSPVCPPIGICTCLHYSIHFVCFYLPSSNCKLLEHGTGVIIIV